MTETSHYWFSTSLGECALAWSDGGIRRVQLPAGDADATRAALYAALPDSTESRPPRAIDNVRARLVRLLDGDVVDFSKVSLDLTQATSFQRRVIAATRRIRRGRTASYSDIARQSGNPRALRAVGRALGANPLPLLVPCHRVVARGNGRGGFSAGGGLTTKAWLLHLEGVDSVAVHGLGYDLFAAAKALRETDPRLARVIELAGFPRLQLQHTASVFHALARAIVYQQLSGKAAATIFARLCALLPRGTADLDADHILAQSDASLRAAGLSNNKMLALKDLSRRTRSGELPTLRQLRSMDDESVIEALTPVRGIGRWTVEMMLMYRLGRPDVMAVDDLGLRQGHAIIMGRSGETPAAKLARYADRWRPWRSVASWYLWRAVELKRAGRFIVRRPTRK